MSTAIFRRQKGTLESEVILEICKCEQGSDEWYEIKLGIVSTSNFDKVLSSGTGRGLYMRKLAAEKLTGISQINYSNDNMENGLEMEGFAREYYGHLKDCPVEQVGFIKRDDWVGTSPDGLVDNNGLIEIKCPIPSTHIDNILKGKMPTCYRPQVQGQLWVAERDWCDWVSYCPTVKSKPFFVTRILKDQKYINVLEVAIEQFVAELKEMISKIVDETEF